MKKISIIFLFLAFLVASTDASIAAAKKPVKPKKTIGSIVSMTDFFLGKETITKPDAVAKADQGSPIVLKVGEGKKAKLYFVINEDGSFGGKNLAKYAANKKVAVEGATKTVGGVNYIIATKIDSFD